MLVLVLLLLLTGSIGYMLQVVPLNLAVVNHERKIVALEDRATLDEKTLRDHDKRIAVLESSVKVQGEDLARVRADLEAARSELRTVSNRVTEGEKERMQLQDDVAALKARVSAMEKDLVKRIEVLEKMNDGKAQR